MLTYLIRFRVWLAHHGPQRPGKRGRAPRFCQDWCSCAGSARCMIWQQSSGHRSVAGSGQPGAATCKRASRASSGLSRRLGN